MRNFASHLLRVSLSVAVLLCANLAVAQSQSVTICDGTEENRYIPFYFYYLDNASATSQVIYPATQLEALKGKQITGMKFYNAGYTGAWNSNMAVSLAEVDYATLPDDNADYISADFTEAFNGSVSGDETMNTLEFTFSTPFVYTGQNLVVEIKNTVTGSTYMQVPFYGQAVSEHINATYGYNSSFKYNQQFLPKVTITYEEISQYGAKISTDAINFSTIFTQETSVKELVITNTGMNDLTATITGLTAPYSVAETQLDVPSLASVKVPVTFAPTSDGSYTQTLNIDLGQAGTYEVHLSGVSMTAPTGYVQAFDVTDKTLPDEWMGWNVKSTYDYDLMDYVYESAEAHSEYFVSCEIDGTKAVTIYEDANPRREYPHQQAIYMVSPVLNGNVMITARGTYSEYTTGEVTIYRATLNNDSTVTIDETPIDVTWLPDFTNKEWCNGIFSLSEESRIAIFMSYGAVSVIAADIKGTTPSIEVNVGDEFVIDGLTYVIKENMTAGVKTVLSEVTECIIPATIRLGNDNYTVASIEEDAFYWSNVTNVTLPETITEIGYGAFRSSPLSSINLPHQLTSIGEYAFYKTELSNIIIPDGVTAIEASTFAQCEKLTEITLPTSLQKIGQGAFYKSNIATIELPATCLTLGMYVFEKCTSLTSIALPEGLEEIPMGLLQDCSSLTEIALPQSVTTIREAAFQNTGITSIHFPKNISEIEANAFNDTPLESITVDAENATFTIIDNALYTTDHRFIYLYPRVTESKRYDIVDGCVAVWGGAFYGCDVKEVTFPDNFIGIDAYAFCYSQLETVTLPNSIEVLWEQAFAGTQLTHVTVPAGVTQLSEALFASCEKLTTVTLPVGLTDVGNRVFYQCTSLSTIECQGTTPAEFDAWETYTNPFFGVDCSQVTIKCPQDYIEDYRLSEWGDFFTNFEGMDTGNITDNMVSDAIITHHNGCIVINFTGEKLHNVVVSHINGTIVCNETDIQGKFTTESLPRGIYLITIIDSQSTRTEKIIL